MLESIQSSYQFVDWCEPINNAHPLGRNVVAWWLAVPGGTGWGSFRWRDLLQENNLTLTNMSVSDSWSRSSVVFGGADDYCVANSDNDTLDFGTGSFSVFASANATSFTNFAAFFYKGAPNNATPGYMLRQVTGTDRYQFVVGNGTSRSASTSSTQSTGEARLCGVYNGSIATLYVNGIAQTAGGSISGSTSSAVTPEIGRGFDGGITYGYFNGRIKSVIIFNRALLAADVLTLYREERHGFPGMLNRISIPLSFMEQPVVAGHPSMRRLALSQGGIYRPVEIGRQGAQVI